MTDARLSQPTRLTASQQEAVAALFAAEESRSGRRPLDESRRILVTSGSAADQWLLIAADGTALAYANVVDSVAELSGLDETAAAEILEAVRESGWRILWDPRGALGRSPGRSGRRATCRARTAPAVG